MSRTAIRCSCGRRIGEREVMQTGYYPRMFGPSLVFVRFRCSRCRKMGQQYVNQEEWENGILKDSNTETNPNEQEKFEALGPIEMDELVLFHRELEALDDLSELTAEFTEECQSETKSDEPH